MRSSVLFLLVFAVFVNLTGTSAVAGTELKSGVAKPRITILKPTTMTEGHSQMADSPSAGGEGMHAGHAPAAGAPTAGDTPVIEDYQLPVKYSTPYGITVDTKGLVWFTEMSNHSLARLDPATGELKEYRLPSAEGLPDPEWDYDPKTKLTTPQSYDVYSVGNPGAITVDGSGMIWFVTLLGNSVVRFDPAKEEFTEIMIPTKNAQPYDLVADQKGRIWFVEKNSSKMGYLDTVSKKMVEIKLAEAANPMGITIDKNGMVWIGDVAGNYLARFDPDTKKMRTFPITVENSQPGQMRFDPTGNLWVCNLRSQQLGVLITDPGVYSVVPLPGYNAVPQSLAPDASNRIWIVDSMTNQIGFFHSTKLTWSIWDIPTANSQPMGIAVDGAGDIWFTQSDRHANKVSRLRVSSIKEEAPQAPAQAGASATPAEAGAPKLKEGSEKTFYLLIAAIILVAGGGMFLVRKFRP